MLATLAAALALQASPYPFAYVNPNGQVALARSSSDLQLFGQGRDPSLSPDGTRLALITESPDRNQSALVIVDLVSGLRRAVRIGILRHPKFSAEGQIAFNAFEEGVWRLWLLDPLAENPRRLTAEDGFHYAWNPDGKTLVRTTFTSILQIGLDGNIAWRRTKPVPESNPFTWQDQIVPHPLRPETFAVVTTDPANQSQILGLVTPDQPFQKLAEGTDPAWTPDGNSLLYTAYPTGSKTPVIHLLDPKTKKSVPLHPGHSPAR